MTDRYSISRDVLAQEVAGETVLLDLAGEGYFGLDEVGTRVWQLLQQGEGQARIVNALLQEYEVGRGELERDIAELLSDLERAGLISRG